jgi:lysophospholipase L1-like esterase
MSDATRQATQIVAAAKSLPPGSTVYVTFELGANDICAPPTTDPAVFQTQIRSATSILSSGLPKGSRILVLSIPSLSHFYDITQADPVAKAKLVNSPSTCPPFLGSGTTVSLDDSQQLLANYNSIMYSACDDIQANYGPSGSLYCSYNDSALAEQDFTIGDISTVDYFHPSLSGQAKIADAAWKAGYWGSLSLPSGASALSPVGSDSQAPVGAMMMMPLLLGLQKRRQKGRFARRA